MHINGNRKLAITSCVILYLLAAALQLLDRSVEGLPVRPSAFSFLAFCIVCITFIVYLQKNTPYRQMRIFLIAAVLLLLLWEVDDMLMMNLFPPQVAVSRYLWYAYYIFTPLIPNCTLIAVLRAGVRYRDRIRTVWYLTFAVTGALAVSVLLNDFHQLAFRFPAGIQAGFTAYTYGPLYYMVMAWVFFLFIFCGVLIRRMIQVSELKRNVWFLYLILISVILYFSGWVTGRRIIPWIDVAIGVPDFWMGIYLLSIEVFIRTGLVRTNFNYQELFEASALSVQIEDRAGVRFRTADMQQPISRLQRRQAMQEAVALDEDHNLHGAPIAGGRVFWVEDLTAVNRARTQLQETLQRLEQENELIEAENKMTARSIKAEEQSRLYSILARRVEPQIQKIGAILDSTAPGAADYREKLALACIYKVYIKRLCNMELLGQEDRSIAFFELRASLEESMEYLRANSIIGGVRVKGEGIFHTDALILLYGIFQRTVEEVLDAQQGAAGLREVQVEVRAEGDLLFLNLTIGAETTEADAGIAETLAGAFDADVRGFGGRFTAQAQTDGLVVYAHNIYGGVKRNVSAS